MNQIVRAVYENGLLRPVTHLRELNEGQEVLLRVEPVAELNAAEMEHREAELEQQMQADGWTEQITPPNEPPPATWQPLVIEGEPLSQTIIQMRGDRG